MTNHDRLLKMCLYDLLMMFSYDTCIVKKFSKQIPEEKRQERCYKYEGCSKCIQAFLNEEAN